MNGSKPRQVSAIPVPPDSRIGETLAGAYFYDSYETAREFHGQSALALYLDGLSRTPSWVNGLMSLRNRIVSLVGLKDLGRLGGVDPGKPASAYRVGDRVGIFSLLYLSDEEIILGDADRHLRVQVSVRKLLREGRSSVAVSTVVHINNLLGRVYMFFVAPLHKIIVPASLARF